MKMNRKLYEYSDDNGHTWKKIWLSEKEVKMLIDNFWMIREIKE